MFNCAHVGSIIAKNANTNQHPSNSHPHCNTVDPVRWIICTYVLRLSWNWQGRSTTDGTQVTLLFRMAVHMQCFMLLHVSRTWDI
jgi:hypothetical protein